MLSLKKWNDRYGPWLFYIGFGLVMLSYNFLWLSDEAPSAISEIQKLALLTGKRLLYLRVLLMFSRHPRLVIGYFVFRLFMAFSIAAGGDQIINLSALAITASCNTNVRVTLRIYASIFLFFIVIAFSSYFLGWAEDIQRHRWGMTGHSWGFSGPARPSFTLMALTMVGLLLFETRSAPKNERVHLYKRKYLLFFSTFLVAVLTFVMTKRLSEPICLLLLPFVYLLFQKKPVLMRWVWLTPLACLLISVFLAWWYGPGYGSTTFESRFSIARMVFDRYGLTLLGQDCGLVGFKTAWKNNIHPLALDNSYMCLFLRNGMIIGSAVMVVWSFILYRIGRMKNSLPASLGVVMSVWFIMESVVFYVYCNFLLFYLWVPYAAKTSGFIRYEEKDAQYAAFIRNLPLLPADSILRYYDGSPNDSLAHFYYKRIATPLLSFLS